MSCPAGSDRSFGPRIDAGCRPFDFTLQFEDIFFACLPAAVFLVLSPSRVVPLLYSPTAPDSSLRSKLLWIKLTTLTGLLAVQLAFVVLRAQDPSLKTQASIAADVLSLVATSTALVLSFLDHKRSPRPSTLLSLYLSALVIFSVARTRTLWLLALGGPMPAVMTAAFSLTVLTLFFESIEKKTSTRSDAGEKSDWRTPAPEQSSGLWARTCFTWLAATFWLGYTRVISVSDLPALDSKLESRVLGKKLTVSWDRYDYQDRHSLLRACFRSFFLSSLSPIIPRLCVTAFTFAQPFLINTTINFVGQTNADINYGKGLVGAWALVYVGIAVSNSVYQYQNLRFTTRLRGGLIALVYQRTVHTRAVDIGDITAISLMGTDVERIVHGAQLFHEVWGSLLDIVVASWLLGQQLFLACLAPIALVLVFIGVTSKLSLSTKTAQLRWIEKIQERLRITSTMLQDIKAVKMLGLTRVMSTIVRSRRVDEIRTSKAFRKLLVVTLLLSLSPINLAPVVTFAIYVIISVFWKNETLLTGLAFTSAALITLLTTPVVLFIQVLPTVIQSIASFDRIQEYCNYGSGSEGGNDTSTLESQPGTKSDGNTVELPEKQVLSFEGQSFGFDKENTAVLKNLYVEIQRGAVIAIAGPVGSGKSAFLYAILGEMRSISTVLKKVPEKWWGAGTMAYCSQQPWLENKTICQNIVGVSPYDRKWYVCVKFACGLDTDIKQLQEGDDTRVGSNGLNLSGGQKQRIALARAIYARREVVILDDVFSGMDVHTADIVSSRLLGREGLLRKHHTTVILATHSHKILSLADSIIVFEDGRTIETGSPAALLRSSGYISRLGLLLSSSSDDVEEIPDDRDPEFSREASHKLDEMSEDTQHLLTDIRRKNGDISVYKYYLKNAGYMAVGLYAFSVVIWVFSIEFSTVWIKWWSEANTAQPNEKVGMYMGIYAMLGIVGTLGAAMAAWFAFIPIISHTAANLHSDLLEATLKAPLRFFTSTDSGELLNRFSEDMELIDMDLPSTMVNYTSTAVSIAAKIVILAFFSQYLVVTILFIGAALYFLQRFYLQTSRQSMAGAATIRAFGWQTHYQERNYRHIDTSQRPTYLQNCIQAWLTFVLNMMVAALAVVLVGTVVIWRDQFSPGSVGVSLLMIIGFSETLTRLIQSWTKLESSVGAVARVKRFTAETESEEDPGRVVDVPPEWPQAGALEFKGVVASHEPNTDPVLKGVSISIQPRQHIAICGRSGSGKTSLVLSLLQMIDVKEGKITLDSVDLAAVRHADLCSRINVIPQDPFMIPGTIHFNVDPNVAGSDLEVTHALERVGLWTIIQGLGGLEMEMDATAWSAGQKQLLCLARAIVKKCNILVLDEAMCSVDSDTESTMQDIIDSEFKNRTVLAVMHRLKHVARYDRVALLGDGELLEYGEPESLMAGDTRFAELYRLNAH